VTNKMKSVIGAQDLPGVAAKLNRCLNRSAITQQKSSEPFLISAIPSARAVAQKFGIRRKRVEHLLGQRIGDYTFRLRYQKDDSNQPRVSIANCFATDKEDALLLLKVDARDKSTSVLDAQLLRYEPIGIKEYLRNEGSTFIAVDRIAA